MIHQTTRHGLHQQHKKGFEYVRKSIVDMTSTKHIFSTQEDEIFCFVAIGDKNKNTGYSDLTG